MEVRVRSLIVLVMLALTACGGGQQSLRSGMRPSLNLADAALSGGTPAIALQVTTELLGREPNSVEALLRHGAALHALGRTTEAQASYTRAISLDPTSVGAALGLGRLQIASNPVEAERLFLQALNRDPRNPAALNNLGIARDLQGRHRDAQSAYAQAITEAPGVSAAQVNMGLSLALSGDPRRAVEMLRSVASQAAAPRPARHNLAAAMAMSGDTAGAESIFRSDLSEEDARRVLDALRMLGEAPVATAQQTASAQPHGS
ncbi:tetratricopeptide repeat protein [Siccirubricoccus deserti]